MLMRYRAPGARHFGAVQRTQLDEPVLRIATLVGRDGSAYVATGGPGGSSEGGEPAAYRVRVAVKPGNRLHFAAARTVEWVPPGALPAVSLAGPLLTARGGHTALAWMGFDGSHTVVREAPFRDGRLGVPATFARPHTNVALGDLVLAPDGRALVSWAASGGASGVAARSGRRFGADDTFPGSGPAGSRFYIPSAPALAITPDGRSMLAAWMTGAADGTSTSLEVATRPLRTPRVRDAG